MELLLRPWRPDDAADLAAAASTTPDLAVQVGGADLLEPEASRRHLVAVDALRPTNLAFAITVDGHAVGNVGLSGIEHTHDTAWVSYWLATSARGQGLAGRAVATVARLAFAELGLFRLELGHRVNNPASCRVALAAGFPAEGLERAKLRYGRDRFDVETHARLATDPDVTLTMPAAW
ncbi:GNAT family N-acetyltransferase [Cellulomonas sp. PhB150]|uniref:GNAT family N-acetyltransferase n=1 Tax=Cellulomonas sp. PhB150 TaxID=2485188 RepID=UPI000F4A5904|nr:GNAT family protein [Cellulomonas sp. PhB150]ROS31067.1 RimJ/RimL family protein N-acetyltransferase [Cellulomonas sp. PhB150]